MKYIQLFYWMLIASMNQVYGQTSSIPDSTRMCAISAYLDTAEIESITLQPIHNLLSGYTIEDRLTFLAAHAKVFDFLLRNGLDLSYNPAANPLMIDSRDIPPKWITKEILEERAIMRKRFQLTHLLFEFLDVKESYERSIIKKFYTGDTRTAKLEADVAEVVRYSGLAFPKTVQNILLLKYRSLTRDKINQEGLKKRH